MPEPWSRCDFSIIRYPFDIRNRPLRSSQFDRPFRVDHRQRRRTVVLSET